jgi:hypothetical protein
VVNREMLAALIASGEASVAALSGWSLSIRCPSVTELTREEQSALREAVDRRYEPWHAVTGFGQADTTLVLYRRR